MLLTLSRWMAFLGGAVLTALILMTCLSITGRLFIDFGLGSINGDVELTEAGIAFAIFAFLPLCHLSGAHATVDIFTARLSSRASRVLQMVIAIAFAGVMVLIAVQLFGGMQSKMRSGQTSFLIQFPVWWAYAASLSGAGLAAVVAIYLAIVRIGEVVQGRDILPPDAGAAH